MLKTSENFFEFSLMGHHFCFDHMTAFLANHNGEGAPHGSYPPDLLIDF